MEGPYALVYTGSLIAMTTSLLQRAPPKIHQPAYNLNAFQPGILSCSPPHYCSTASRPLQHPPSNTALTPVLRLHLLQSLPLLDVP